MKSLPAEPLTPDQLRRGADCLAALAHPVRLRIAGGLLGGTCCVLPMVECLGLSQGLVSRHLAVLRAAGIVSCERHGRTRVYRLAHPIVAQLIPVLQQNLEEKAA